MEVKFQNVEFTYEGTAEGALKNVNLTIRDGEFLVLIGESGCGKSTMTRLINGLSPGFYRGSLKGEVLLGGRNVAEMESHELSKHVGSVFQNPRTQFFNVDTDSEIVFGLENQGVPREEISKRLEEVTGELSLEKLRNRDIFQLSGGEKQKIAFAGVYASSPDVFVLDEPSSNLDHQGVEELKKCLEKVKREGKTVVMAEHRLYYLTGLADRFAYLERGEIKRILTAEELLSLSEEALEKMGIRSGREGCAERRFAMAEKGEEQYADGQGGLLLKNLTLRRGKRVLLQDLCLSAPLGKVTGIVGRNGIGKTTLLRTISGLHKEWSGEIWFGGERMSPGELVKRAYLVMQDVNYQLFAETVRGECELGRKAVKEETVRGSLEEMGLWEFRERHPNTLSGGQKQRLSVAVSVVMGKDLILFDEPTSGLDGRNARRISRVMRELAGQGKCVIVVTHDDEFLTRCCDLVAMLGEE